MTNDNLRYKYKVGDTVCYSLGKNKRGSAIGKIESITSFSENTPYEQIIVVIIDSLGNFKKTANLGQIISRN